MATILNELNAEQTKGLEIIKNKYLDIGLDCSPADRPTAEKGINDIYIQAGLKVPRKIFWFDDPVQAKAFIVEKSASVGAAITAQNVLDNVFYGQHEVGWMSFYAFFRQYAPQIEGPEKLVAHDSIARSCSWVWPFAGFAVAVERPLHVRLDGNPKERLSALSSTTDAAIEWRSGLKMYFIRGIPVAKEVIEGGLTLEMIKKEENSEVRRVMIEKFGASKYLLEMGATRLHQDIRGTLFRAEIPDDEALVMIRYVNRSPEAGLDDCPHCHKPGTEDIEFSAKNKNRNTLHGTFCKCGSFVNSEGGLFKTYWHRVPPDTATAKAAYEFMYQPGVKNWVIDQES